MSEPIEKPGRTPESYSPKKPEIVTMMDEAQNSVAQRSEMKEGRITMKKIIANATHQSGWEYWYFPSCFASVYMRIEGVTANRQEVITLYSLVSGVSHVQLDLTNEEHFVPGVGYNENKVIDEYDDYIKFTMGFAGYLYERFRKGADKSTVFAAVKKSIEADRPVLMNFGTQYSWCVIVGYDEGEGTLYGLDNAGAGESYWKDKPSVREDGMFVTGHWYESMTEAVVVTGKTAPTVTYDDVFRRLINIQEAMEKRGYLRHTADYLLDDANFSGYDDEKYLLLAGRIHTLVALLIDQRAWMSHFFNIMAGTETFTGKAEDFRLLASLYGISKDVCWIAWNMVGAEGFFKNTPGMKQEDSAKLLPSLLYRHAIADVIKTAMGSDRYILACWKKMMGVNASDE